MENKQRSLGITLLLALTLFGGLIYYTSFDRTVEQSGYHAHVGYGIDVELKWIAEADQADYVVVQETLSHYANLVGMSSGALGSRFKLDHCCDDADLQAAMGGHSDFYHLTASLDFEAPDASRQLLSALIDQGYLELGNFTNFYGMVHGEAAMHLPIVGSIAEVLHIRNSAFDVQLVPRISGVTQMDPEA
jgi:hypothetical protein